MEFSLVSANSVRQRLLMITIRLIAFFIAYQQERSVRAEPGGHGGVSGAGLCSFSGVTACCLGWSLVDGVCQPVCEQPCKHGVCVGPEKCSCVAGYAGQRCEEDENECGLAARPCSQRCMNTWGSYRCYCDPGYTLHTDGHACTRESKCSSARCQFGCQTEKGGEVVCQCPPGLHLAKDNRTCEDVDECERRPAMCPPRHACRNTFGSFTCTCGDGFILGTLRNAVRCRDVDECVTGSHRCSRQARCVNTDGGYRCRCLEAYSGDGLTCRPRTAPQTRAALYFRYKLSKRTKATQPLL